MVQICSNGFWQVNFIYKLYVELLFVNAILTLCQTIYKTGIKAQNARKFPSVCYS